MWVGAMVEYVIGFLREFRFEACFIGEVVLGKGDLTTLLDVF